MHAPRHLLLAACLALASCARALETQNSFKVSPVPLTSVTEATAQLRRLLGTKMPQDERCARYAVLLNTRSGHSIDDRWANELALTPMEKVRERYRRIDKESLRDLYMEAIDELRATNVGPCLMELLECLGIFRSVDARARAYLNDNDLKALVAQYKAASGLPMTVLSEQCLDVEDMKPALQESFRRVLQNRVCGAAHSQPASADAIPEAAEPEPEPAEGAPAEDGQSRPEEGAEKGSENLEQGSTSESGQSVGSDANGGASNEILDLTDDDKLYLEKLIKALSDAYETFPETSKLPDRCEAYQKIILADRRTIQLPEFVPEVVRNVEEKIQTMGPATEPFHPLKDEREDFLVLLSAFDPTKGDAAYTWVDIVDCVSQWRDEDEDVRTFLASDEVKENMAALG